MAEARGEVDVEGEEAGYSMREFVAAVFCVFFSWAFMSVSKVRVQVTQPKSSMLQWEWVFLPVHYRHHHGNRKIMPSNPRTQSPNLLLKMLRRIFGTRLRTLLIHRTAQRT